MLSKNTHATLKCHIQQAENQTPAVVIEVEAAHVPMLFF